MTTNQFGGQLLHTLNGTPFSSLYTALLDLNLKDREYCQAFIVSMKYAANDYMETLCMDENLGAMASDEVYTFR